MGTCTPHSLNVFAPSPPPAACSFSMCVLLTKVKQSSRARGGGTGRIPTPKTNAPGGVGAVEGAKGQGEPSSISARCELNDWRINLIEVRRDCERITGGSKWFGFVSPKPHETLFSPSLPRLHRAGVLLCPLLMFEFMKRRLATVGCVCRACGSCSTRCVCSRLLFLTSGLPSCNLFCFAERRGVIFCGAPHAP